MALKFQKHLRGQNLEANMYFKIPMGKWDKLRKYRMALKRVKILQGALKARDREISRLRDRVVSLFDENGRLVGKNSKLQTDLFIERARKSSSNSTAASKKLRIPGAV